MKTLNRTFATNDVNSATSSHGANRYPKTPTAGVLLIAAVAALSAFAGCAPDPEPPLGLNDPSTNNDDPDMGTPDSSDPDTSRPTDPDRPRDPDAGSDMAGADMAGADMSEPDASAAGCEAMDCGHGTCLELAGEFLCGCDAGFGGETCSECDSGYMGTLCDECADGFLPDPLGGGACLPDPCLPDPCNGNGACFPSTDPTGASTTDCRCDAGFAGEACDMCETGYTGTNCDMCDAGYTLENGVCVILACSPAPCDHGLCLDSDGNGTAECVCESGWTGRDCGTCAVGFLFDAASGQCVPDVCLNVDCGHGSCIPNPTNGLALCLCDTGYDGGSCDVCAYGYTEIRAGICENSLPVRDSRITGWFDAAETNTFSLTANGHVRAWRNRVQPSSFLEPGDSDLLRPRYVLLPKPAVEFDGRDALWAPHNLVGVTDAYSIFVVASWNPTTPGDFLLDSFGATNFDVSYSIKVWDEFAEFAHSDASNVADSQKLDGYDPAAGPQLVIAQRQPFLNGQMMTVSDGARTATAQSTVANFSEVTVSMLGAKALPAYWGAEGLNGNVHEIIYVRGSLSTAERDAISAYLTVKWGL